MTLDDNTLMAYVDGELDDQTNAAVEEALSTDERARDYVQHLMEVAQLSRNAFNDVIHEAVPERLLEAINTASAQQPNMQAANVHTMPEPKKTFHQHAQSWSLPMAAAIAGLMIGSGGGFGVSQVSTNHATQQAAYHHQLDTQSAQAALGRALEVNVSGTALDWTNPDTGTSGSVVPVRTYQDANGSYCREYQQNLANTASVDAQTTFGLACRADDGQWKTRFLIIDPEQATSF